VAVIGIGLNVAPLAGATFDTGFACLQEIDAQATAPGALSTLAAPLLRALQRFEAAGFAAFAADFARRDLLRGRRITAATAGIDDGVAEGVDRRGALLVRAGILHALVSGEVSVRPLPMGTGSH
jgi:BirA family biotin operon repressor/biotin-[acetyl-CoA-carboxylase] ligase